MKKAMKFLHTLGAIGLTGAIAVHLILLDSAPAPSSLAEYTAVRTSIAAVATWMLLPSLALVLLSGLMAIAAHPEFGSAGWVGAKVLLGLAIFEGTLVSIQGPAVRNAEAAAAALAGDMEAAALPGLIHSEWGALWVVLVVCIANILLAVWRPRMSRRSREASPTESPAAP